MGHHWELGTSAEVTFEDLGLDDLLEVSHKAVEPGTSSLPSVQAQSSSLIF